MACSALTRSTTSSSERLGESSRREASARKRRERRQGESSESAVQLRKYSMPDTRSRERDRFGWPPTWCALPVGGGAWSAARCRENSDPTIRSVRHGRRDRSTSSCRVPPHGYDRVETPGFLGEGFRNERVPPSWLLEYALASAKGTSTPLADLRATIPCALQSQSHRS